MSSIYLRILQKRSRLLFIFFSHAVLIDSWAHRLDPSQLASIEIAQGNRAQRLHKSQQGGNVSSQAGAEFEAVGNGTLSTRSNVSYEAVSRLEPVLARRHQNLELNSSLLEEARTEDHSASELSFSRRNRSARSRGKWNGIKQFSIILDQDVYNPGQLVKGSVSMIIDKEVKARSIKLKVHGKGVSEFKVKIGEDWHLVTGKSTYCKESITLWGSIVKTPVIDGAGNTLRFGPPWAPNEGLLYLPIDDLNQQVMLRVMDDDKVKSDDLLGFVSIPAVKLTKLREMQTFALTKQGTISLRSQLADKAEVPARKTEVNGEPLLLARQVLKIEIIQVAGLRKGDWIGRNDVFVQAFVPPAPDNGKKLPPLKPIPKGLLTFPFEFKLPAKLPTTNERAGITGAVRYSIRCVIDKKRTWLDPAVKRIFTVLSAAMPAVPNIPLRGSKQLDKKFAINAQLDRSDYAPGQRFHLQGTIQNLKAKKQTYAIVVTARIARTGFRFEHGGNCARWVETVPVSTTLWEGQVSANGKLKLEDIEQPLLVPLLAGTYWPGGAIQKPDGDWGQRFQGWFGLGMLQTYDAMKWRYDIQIARKNWKSNSLVGWREGITLPIVITNYPSLETNTHLRMIRDNFNEFRDEEDGAYYFGEHWRETSRIFNKGAVYYFTAEGGTKQQVNLKVIIVKAENLRNANITLIAGVSDPYVVLKVRGSPYKGYRTKTIWNDLNPTWNEECFIYDYNEQEPLEFKVWDEDPKQPKSDDKLGWAHLHPDKFLTRGFDGSLDLAEAGKNQHAKLYVKVNPFYGDNKGTEVTLINKGITVDEIRSLKNAGIPAEQIFPPTAKLKVKVISASKLPSEDVFSQKSDPYCIVELQGKQQGQTRRINGTTDPQWNEAFIFEDYELGDTLFFHVYDHDVIKNLEEKMFGFQKDDWLGTAHLASRDFMPHGFYGSLILETLNIAKMLVEQSTLQVSVDVMPQGGWTPPNEILGKPFSMARDVLASEEVNILKE